MTARAVAALAAALLLAGCSDPTSGRPAPSATTGTTDTTTTTTTPTTTKEAAMTISLQVEGRTVPVELGDGPAARDLLARLPITTTFRDYGGQEKIGDLERPLTTDGEPASAGGATGDLGYYAPDQVLVLYYSDVPPYPGIVHLGRMPLADMAALRALPDGFTATLTRP